MSDQGLGTRTTVSLDTNILHYIGLVLDYADEQNLSWDANVDDETIGIAAVLTQLETQPTEAAIRSLKQGGQTLKWLIDEDAEVQYSMLTELELLTGRTRGKAIVHAASEGLPERMWSRFQEREVRERVSLQEIDNLRRGVAALLGRLETSGVSVGQMSEAHSAEVSEMANGICSLVYMDPLDGLIYATCLVTQSTYLFTADRYLRETVNNIVTQADSRYTDICNELHDLMATIIGDGNGGLTLPSAHMITANGHVKPHPQQLAGVSAT